MCQKLLLCTYFFQSNSLDPPSWKAGKVGFNSPANEKLQGQEEIAIQETDEAVGEK